MKLYRNVGKAFIYVMFSVLSLYMVNTIHTVLLEIETNEKLFSVVRTMEEHLKHQNLS